MTTQLAQFDKALESLLGTKPPGVSGSKVQELTKLAVQNVKDNAQFITHLYKHFRLSPGTHKLGVLYVVDSIARMYQTEARRHGQNITTTTDDTTFAGGLRHITSVLPSLMNDIIQHAPDNQKEKIKKLLDIWTRSKTFPEDTIAEFRQKLEIESTTPIGTPPSPPPPVKTEPTGPPDAASILSALAEMAKAPPAATAPASQVPAPLNPNAADPRFRNAMSPPQPTIAPAIIPPQLPPAPAVQPVPAANPLAALAALLPQQPQLYFPTSSQINLDVRQPAAPAIDTQKLTIIQLLLQQGVPIEQVTAILTAQQPAQLVPLPQQQPQQQAADKSQYPISPPPRGRARSRSRSPPPPRRRSPSRSISPPSPRGRGRGRGRRRPDDLNSPPPPQRHRRSPSYEDYRRPQSPSSRSRSPPPPRRRSPPPRERSPHRSGPGTKEFKPRFIETDDSLKPDRIRVLSRTLFVGGVTHRITEEKLREWFGRFGEVQSVITNPEKRCAFLKMYTRDGAVAAREGMETFPTDDTVIRTKYGVGFGPRDCSDYATGISIIPIARLTDADRKWVVTAEYGGTGGRPLEAGMTLEEPDIEIGAGVSSKAISQKMNLRGTRQDGNGGGRGRGRGRGAGGGEPRDEQRNWNQDAEFQQGGGRDGGGGPAGAMHMGFPPFPMQPGMFPPFMMPPQMQAFFQQQFGGGGQGSHEGYSGFSEQGGNEGK